MWPAFAQSGGSFLDSEDGISAYTDTGQTINLNASISVAIRRAGVPEFEGIGNRLPLMAN